MIKLFSIGNLYWNFYLHIQYPMNNKLAIILRQVSFKNNLHKKKLYATLFLFNYYIYNS